MKFFGKNEESRPDPVIEELRQKIARSGMPAQAEQIAFKELDMLGRVSPSTTEFTIGLSYIEYLASLPWNIRTDDDLDIDRAERILNEHHYGLENIKDRVLEFLAVKKLKMERKPMILVVDDEVVARRNLDHILSKENYTVVTAANGAEAFEKLSQAEFDVVLTDFRMEKIDGMEVLAKIKARSPNTEVIMITGYATIDTAIEAMKKGAFHYIPKPFKIDEVRATVKQALDKRSYRQDTKGSVLCFSGPPGTGKTSLGRSIALALGRTFARISVGGIKDEADRGDDAFGPRPSCRRHQGEGPCCKEGRGQDGYPAPPKLPRHREPAPGCEGRPRLSLRRPDRRCGRCRIDPSRTLIVQSA
ncbi:MAG: sigma-54-dependent transcriptional regulator [Thermodesulfovibrionales bacterium]